MDFTRFFVKELLGRLNENLNFMQVVIGPRQVGKTTGVKWLLENWSGPKLYVTADEVISPNGDWLELHWKRARTLGEGTVFVVDEVQKITNWERVVKKCFDEDRETKRLRIVLLGSASLVIQKGLSESLAGRYEILHVPHWSYLECRNAFSYTLSDYLKFGGYPALSQLRNDILRFQQFVKDSIVEPVLGRDILSINVVGKPALFRQAFELAMHYPSQELSYQKMLGQLQDRGNVTTIKHYLELLQGAFILRLLEKFSVHPVTGKSSSPKILPQNIALVNAFTDPVEIEENPEWRGRIVETAVGNHLLDFDDLWYWRDGRNEVDFIFAHKKRIYAIEVKSGRKRNGEGLAKFSANHRGAVPIIIDKDNLEEFLLAPNGRKYLVDKYGH